MDTYYLAKCIVKHFGKINIGDSDEMQWNMTPNRQSLLLANISSYTEMEQAPFTPEWNSDSNHI